MTIYITADDVKTGTGFHRAASEVAQAKGITFEEAVTELNYEFSARPGESKPSPSPTAIIARAHKLVEERGMTFDAAVERAAAEL